MKANSQPITGDSTGALGRAHEAAEGFREVYVNRIGEAGFSDSGEFREGTIIVKEAFAESDGDKGDLTAVTVMVKREDGFDSGNGNGEYVNASADLKIRGQGAIRSCIVCHAQAENEYIFANY